MSRRVILLLEGDMMERNKNNCNWYDNPKIIVLSIIGVIILSILGSQSFVDVFEVDALRLVQNILNHNIVYMFALAYFIFLFTKFGRRYFDYLNVIMVVLLGFVFVTSCLSLFKSLSLASILVFISAFLVFTYSVHVFFRGSIFWDEFHLKNSPFVEITSQTYFEMITGVEALLFAVNLISVSTTNGAFLVTFDAVYTILFARYIYLYNRYLDSINKNCYSSAVDNSDVATTSGDVEGINDGSKSGVVWKEKSKEKAVAGKEDRTGDKKNVDEEGGK